MFLILSPVSVKNQCTRSNHGCHCTNIAALTLFSHVYCFLCLDKTDVSQRRFEMHADVAFQYHKWMICKSIKVLPGHLSRLRIFSLSLGTKCLHIPNYHSFTILLQLLSIAISRYSLFLIEKRKCSISLKSVIQFFNYNIIFAHLV